MQQQFKMNYLKKIYQRYHRSSKKEKKQILDEFCNVCNYNRKYAIRTLNDIPPQDRPSKPRKRNFKYAHAVICVLEEIWEATDYLCSQRLKPAIPLWLPWAKQRFQITPQTEKQLLAISSATIDRRLKTKKYQIKKKLYSSTRPGLLLKNQIPVRTDNWDIKRPGFLEIDLVAHCGNSASGDYISTLDCVDIHTTWIERRAVMGRGQYETFLAVNEIKQALPFPLLGIDPDNDQAFINYHLYNYCLNNKIQFTHSRPYKKDDNAHVEQKNFTHVRKIIGYGRYDTPQAQELLNDLYRSELRWFQNFFQPSMKLVKKIRIGSKIKRTYDQPKTPLQRVCECGYADPLKLSKLKELFESLNPFELRKTIDKKLNKIYEMQTRKYKTQTTFEERLNAELLQDLSKYNYGYLFK